MKYLVVLYLLMLALASYSMENFFQKKTKGLYYVPPATSLKLLSGTYQSCCADVYYIRGVMAVTDKLDDSINQIQWVQKNMSVAVELDPRLTNAYFFGGVVVAKNRQGLRKGLDFLEHGTKVYSNEWRIWYWKGFVHNQLGEFVAAAQCYQQAAELPGSPSFLRGIQPMMFYRAHNYELGVIQIEGMLKSLKDPRQVELIKPKLQWLKNLASLQRLVNIYEKRFGKRPQTLQDLVSVGLLSEIPQDTFGYGYFIDDEGKVVSQLQLQRK